VDGRSQHNVVDYLISRDASDSIIVLLSTRQFEPTKTLIEAGKSITFPWPDNRRTTHLACSDDAVDVLKLLIEKDADVNCKDDGSVTPLIMALMLMIGKRSSYYSR
jgi:hypothetical protein